jgi:TRAP-type C4-dicarboxylate transport system permease small subunit
MLPDDLTSESSEPVASLKTFNHLLERLALAILLIGGVGLLMSMFLGVGDVVGTQVLKTPLPGARELTESTMVLIVFGALTYAQIQRSHIRVELLYTRMRPRVQALMDVVTDLAAIVFFGLLFWQAINEVKISWEIGESTVGLIRFPLYPARIILAVGTGLLIIRLTLDLMIDIRRVSTGEPLPNQHAIIPGVPLADRPDDAGRSQTN